MSQEPGGIDNWALLVDPNWQATHPDQAPPNEAMVGGWLLDEAGQKGPFQPNPDFVPRDDVTPTDPTDAVLRLIARGEAGVDELVASLRDGIVEIALHTEAEPLVVMSPDNVRCVLVVTAPAHRNRLDLAPDQWAPLPGAELAEVIPEGLDILLNPDGPAGFRLVAEVLRAS